MNAIHFVIAFGLCQCLGRRVVQLPKLQEKESAGDLQNSLSVDDATSGSLPMLLLALSSATLRQRTIPFVSAAERNRPGYDAVPSRKLQARLTSRSSSPEMAAKYDKSKYITVSISKPMGAAFEEVVEDAAKGIYLSQVVEDGNAAKAGLKSGLVLAEANGIDMRLKTFEDAMDVLGNAPADQPLSLTFVPLNSVKTGEAILTVVGEDGTQKTVACKKGDILRNVLLDGGFPVYTFQGKMMNCNGGAQCGLCVIGLEVPEDDAWGERFDFENNKLKKYPANCRLSCQTFIEGDAKVQLQPSQV